MEEIPSLTVRMQRKQEERYKQILSEVLYVLEGGDVALDLPDMPGAAVTIRIIADIAGNALKNINESRELLDALQGATK